MKLKYVYFDPTDWDIFPDTQNHLAKARSMHPKTMPLSAGFCEINQGRVTVYGESTSLGLQANPEHGRIMTLAMGGRVEA